MPSNSRNLFPSFGSHKFFTGNNLFFGDLSMVQDTEKHKALTQVRCGLFPWNDAAQRKIEQTMTKTTFLLCDATPSELNLLNGIWFISAGYNTKLQNNELKFPYVLAQFNNTQNNLSTIYKDNSRTCSAKSLSNKWLQVGFQMKFLQL